LQGLTPLGKALRWRDADLVSAWERDYGEAIKAAIAGDVKRVVNLLRAHRALGDDDFDALADYLEATAKHGHRRRDATVHQAARMAEMVLDIYPGSRKPDSVRARAIDIACEQMERETGEVVQSERGARSLESSEATTVSAIRSDLMAETSVATTLIVRVA
jgi:hypothetical protein